MHNALYQNMYVNAASKIEEKKKKIKVKCKKTSRNQKVLKIIGVKKQATLNFSIISYISMSKKQLSAFFPNKQKNS